MKVKVKMNNKEKKRPLASAGRLGGIVENGTKEGDSPVESRGNSGTQHASGRLNASAWEQRDGEG